MQASYIKSLAEEVTEGEDRHRTLASVLQHGTTALGLGLKAPCHRRKSTRPHQCIIKPDSLLNWLQKSPAGHEVYEREHGPYVGCVMGRYGWASLRRRAEELRKRALREEEKRAVEAELRQLRDDLESVLDFLPGHDFEDCLKTLAILDACRHRLNLLQARRSDPLLARIVPAFSFASELEESLSEIDDGRTQYALFLLVLSARLCVTDFQKIRDSVVDDRRLLQLESEIASAVRWQFGEQRLRAWERWKHLVEVRPGDAIRSVFADVPDSPVPYPRE